MFTRLLDEKDDDTAGEEKDGNNDADEHADVSYVSIWEFPKIGDPNVIP